MQLKQKKICTVYGEGAVAEQKCLKWFTQFHAGDFSLDDAPWSGRPVEVDSDQVETLMENGQHYLTDISACDTGLPGEPDYLFLAGSSTGAVETGYAFSANNGSAVTYVYSPDMIAAYTAPALTMAPKSYSGKYDGQ